MGKPFNAPVMVEHKEIDNLFNKLQTLFLDKEISVSSLIIIIVIIIVVRSIVSGIVIIKKKK